MSAHIVAALSNMSLRMVGLPPIDKLIGAKFIFSDEKHFIAGTITAVGYGPEEGVSLRLSAPRFRGLENFTLRYVEKSEWITHGGTRSSQDRLPAVERQYVGQLHIYQ